MKKVYRAVMCDRCGKMGLQEIYGPKNEDLWALRDWMIDWKVDGKNADLCPECYAWVKNFVSDFDFGSGHGPWKRNITGESEVVHVDDIPTPWPGMR